MTTQTQVAKSQEKFPIKALFESPNVKQKLQELLNKNAATFTTSVLQIVNSNSLLRNADPMTVFIDFVLFPTPFDLLSPYENSERYIDLVEQIPQAKRITTVTIYRDDDAIAKIQDRVSVAQKYYNQLIQEMS